MLDRKVRRRPAAAKSVFASVESLERRSLMSGGTITGSVFLDVQPDGRFLTNDPQTGRPAFTVFLDQNRNGRLETKEVSTTTNVNGQYSFSDLLDGRYYVRVLTPTGFKVQGAARKTVLVNINKGSHVAVNPIQVVNQLPTWGNLGNDAQHQGVSVLNTEPLNAEQFGFIKDDPASTNVVAYGTPVVTRYGTIIVPIQTTTRFEIRAYSAGLANQNDHHLLWTIGSDYAQAPGQAAAFSVALTPDNRLVFPRAGGRIGVLSDPDFPADRTTFLPAKTWTFYGDRFYNASTTTPGMFNTRIFINTPLTVNSRGQVIFGYYATTSGATIRRNGKNVDLHGGVARVDAVTGASGFSDNWLTLKNQQATFANTFVVPGAAPAVNGDKIYYVMNGPSGAELVQTDGKTLRKSKTVAVTVDGTPVTLPTNGLVASPAIAPGGDVYLPVAGTTGGANFGRGELLHFGANLKAMTSGAVGSDATVSIVPSSLVSSYHGRSKYLVLAKYNEEAADGRPNRAVLLDPNSSSADPISNEPVMDEVLSIAAPAGAGTWNFSSVAVSSETKSAFLTNSNSGVYRWDLNENRFGEIFIVSPSAVSSATGKTVINIDGTILANVNSDNTGNAENKDLVILGFNLSGGTPIPTSST